MTNRDKIVEIHSELCAIANTLAESVKGTPDRGGVMFICGLLLSAATILELVDRHFGELNGPH